MTINTESAEPAPISGGTRRETREAKRRQRVITLVVLTAVARTARDRRTVAGVIVLAIGLAAMKGIAEQRGVPGLDWYLRRALGRNESRPA